MTQLRKKVLEELERRNYSQATANAYVAAIRRFAEYFRRSPDQLGSEHVRPPTVRADPAVHVSRGPGLPRLAREGSARGRPPGTALG